MCHQCLTNGISKAVDAAQVLCAHAHYPPTYTWIKERSRKLLTNIMASGGPSRQQLQELETFIKYVQKCPDVLHEPDMKFFTEYLQR